MAIFSNVALGKCKGKIGGIVFQQYEGILVGREWQPNVKNPQSDNQVRVRANFKLSSQIVAQFKEVFSARLGKLAIYERMRRAAAVNAIYNVVDDGTPDNPQALIDSVVAAINAKSVSAEAAPEFSLVSNNVQTDVNEGTTLLCVICAYDATKGDLIARGVQTYDGTGGVVQVTAPDASRQIVMGVYLTPNTEDGRATISNITANATAWQNEIARSVAAGDISISNLGGYVVAPAS